MTFYVYVSDTMKDNQIFHPLAVTQPLPSQMNNPFDYEPHPLCLQAAQEVSAYIAAKAEWQAEMTAGKMFGVLLVQRQDGGEVGFLAAYSGQICGRSDWQGFVPAVFDYLQPDGYFKTNEAEISQKNTEIARLSELPERKRLKREITLLLQEREQAVEKQRLVIAGAKLLRDQRRKERHLTREEKEAMIRESQFQKAQLRRIKQHFSDEIGEKEAKTVILNAQIKALEQQRKERSRSLQYWLFSHFEMLNAEGERRSLVDIFAETAFKEPPSGAGECCEPKLLQYAYAHQLKPLNIAMFWYGGHPQSEIRHHGQFYPACSGKCKPILRWMLGGDQLADHKDSDDGSHEAMAGRCGEVEIVYEDRDMVVVNKPDGLLSVPGIETKYSVWKIFTDRYPNLHIFLVHRLDMATSGLLLIAKSRAVHARLQRQFAERSIQKRYVALLDGDVAAGTPRRGTISLPLRPDLFDRPRQVVDRVDGKEAVTDYHIMATGNGMTRIELFPKTGRTHQLRMHCAHPDGLGLPIIGDVLYGRRADRLYLHAASIDFTHPTTGKRMHLETKVPF